MKKTIFLIAFIICGCGTTQAQFFKKLGKKVSQAAEKAVERKTEQKTTKETEKAFDSTFNKKRKKKTRSGTLGMSSTIPADSYEFEYKVEMQFTTKKEVMDVNYFLPQSENYLCAQVKDDRIKDDFYTVFDIDRDAMFTYMKNDGKKIKMAVDLKTEDSDDDDDTIDIAATGNSKVIMGYNCLEYKMTGKDMTATIWVTQDVDIRFPSTFYDVEQNQNNQAWMKDIDGWAMEMVMIDTSRRKPQTITMKCLSIETTDFKINSSDYQSLNY
ncbi:MAG: DUF4412 domain-containing protein [Nonlabens sp.]|uniref:DUF4412 domain-containing protein n=1 Tax=Nonlabens sp. TaxID=1888209 RepID=UPI003EF350B7